VGRRNVLRALSVLPLGAALAGCGARDGRKEDKVVVFRHPKMFGDPTALNVVIAEFERASGVRVRREALPASSDEQHLFYAINLQARSRAFDVLALDTIWTAEFAKAGWLREITHLLSAEDRTDFFSGALASVTWQGRIHALPWFADAGLLYWRKDLLARYAVAPPQTWDELLAATRAVKAAQPGLHGFVWQGKQYEGLVCNALEFVWSHGGDLDAAQVREAIDGLEFMRALVTKGVSPPWVTTLTEESARVIFGRGDALFLRNWPYAWRLFEREGSMLRGRVGMSVLPHALGEQSAGTLGGWQLGVNAFSLRTAVAEQLAAYLTAPAAQKALALAYGYSPPRRSLYADAEFAAAQPFLASLRGVLEAARPRPVSPHYVALSQTLQAQFSAVLTGVRSPQAALDRMLRTAAALERR
jgi:multiple sugar transport system substrate-binding protein